MNVEMKSLSCWISRSQEGSLHFETSDYSLLGQRLSPQRGRGQTHSNTINRGRT